MPANASAKRSRLFWDQLCQAIEGHQVIPILGPDLLTIEVDGQKTLFQRYLAEQVADYLDLEATNLPERGELNALACQWRNGPGRGSLTDLHTALAEVMPKKGEIEIPEPLLKLAEIRQIKLFITTTFDPLMKWALEEKRGDQTEVKVLEYSPASVEDLTGPVANMRHPTVYHLLGKQSVTQDFALTEEDTLEFVHALQSRGRRPRMLFDELERQQVLIIGSSFSNWLARFFVRATADKRLSEAESTYFVADFAAQDKHLRSFLKNFTRNTKLFDDGGPVEFTNQLHEQWQQRGLDQAAEPAGGPARKPVAIRKVNEHDEDHGKVFLSYSHQPNDAAAARRVVEMLEDAGIDVWIDKQELRAGEKFGQEIKDAIEAAALFIPIISETTASERRSYIQKEWKYANEEAEEAPENVQFILPLAIDDTPEQDENVPASWRELHWSRAPEGECSGEFVNEVLQLQRAYRLANRG